jgi:hypothetical protein
LRETAFNLWLACYSNEEIADQIGYSRPAISEFVNLLQDVRNETGSVSDVSSENDELTFEALQEFDESVEEEAVGGDVA